ncbi:hypothetical protein R50072_32410 [Simiduia litorea]
MSYVALVAGSAALACAHGYRLLKAQYRVRPQLIAQASAGMAAAIKKTVEPRRYMDRAIPEKIAPTSNST